MHPARVTGNGRVLRVHAAGGQAVHGGARRRGGRRPVPPAALVLGSTLALVAIGAGGGADRAESPPTDPREVTQARNQESPSPRHEYVGTKRCRMCHGKWYESWLELAKGNSWDDLLPGFAGDAKRRAGLDPKRDYTTDTRCLTCHTVGFAERGGYAPVQPGDDVGARRAAARRGVGCEACHGPGSGFTKIMSEVRRTGRTYAPKELYAAGLQKPGVDTCTKCHNQRAICQPTGDDGKRILRTDLGAIVLDDPAAAGAHVHFVLEYRERPSGGDDPGADDP